MMLLVIGAIAVGVAKRCDWLGICDTTYNYPQAEAEAKKERQKKGEPEPKEEEKPGLGNLDAVQKSVAISQKPLQPVTNVKATDAASANQNASESCHFSQACSALVRIWRGAGADPCIPCGAQAKFARSNYAINKFNKVAYF